VLVRVCACTCGTVCVCVCRQSIPVDCCEYAYYRVAKTHRIP